MTIMERPRVASRTSRWSIPAAILTAAFMLFGVMSAPASAAPADATVEGAVMNSSGDPLSGVTVEFFDEDVYVNPEAAPISSVMTSGGSFVTDVPADDEEFAPVWLRLSKFGYETDVFGPYDVRGGDWTYLDSFWLNEDVTAYGTLTGVVTDASGSPLPHGRAYVTIFEDGDPEGDYWDYYVREIQANVSGNWSAQLPQGQYRVSAFDDWGDLRSAWAGSGATSYATAAVQTVTTGGTTTVPQMRLTDGARISGKVTDSQGSPIKGVSVAAFNGEDDDIEWATTNSRGEYTLSGLDSGTLRLQFSDYIGDYATTWYANGTSYASATDVVVVDGQVKPGIDVVLADSNDAPPAHRVSGKVVDRTGKGQRGAYVTAYRKVGSNWEWWDSTSVRKTGSFGYTGLPAGQYAFRVSGESSNDDPGFETQWIGGAFSRERAQLFNVAETGTVNLGTLTVSRHGQIAGTITVPALAGHPGVDRWVDVFNLDGEQVAGGGVSTAGTFTVAVAPGVYTVRFGASRYDDLDRYVDYVPQWWKGAFSQGAATRITVGDGARLTGINATLGRNLTPVVAPTIAGTALTGKTLTASPGTWSRQSSTLYAYQWKVGGVNAGTATTYKVKATDRGKAITVVVTARDKYDYFGAGTATAKAVVAKEVAKVAVSAKVAKPAKKKPKAARKATVTVALSLPGTAKARVAGTWTDHRC